MYNYMYFYEPLVLYMKRHKVGMANYMIAKIPPPLDLYNHIMHVAYGVPSVSKIILR